jgi:hypothetical protein
MMIESVKEPALKAIFWLARIELSTYSGRGRIKGEATGCEMKT